MPESSTTKTKDKITHIASTEGLERANQALKRLGFASKEKFAKSILLSRGTITKFFQRQPIQFDSFKKICDELKLLDWTEIAELPEKEQSNGLVKNICSTPDINNEQMQKKYRQLSVIDKDSKTIKAVIVLEGDINSINNDLSVSLELFLRKYSGHTIKITDIKEGSIRLFVEGSPEHIEQLVSSIKSGELKTVTGFPVENVQILSESSNNDESIEFDEKWRLIQEIVSQPVKMRHLSGVDLSDADLRRADLRRADLSDADLSDADLSGAKLGDAILSNAILSGAILSGANLTGANLTGANLIGANLIGTKLFSAIGLGAAVGLIHRSYAFDMSFLDDAIFGNADLSNADLSNADLSGVNLSGVNLSDADLSGANLSGANLSGVNLRSVNLSDANLSGVYLIYTNLSGVNLSGIVLHSANLRYANLSDADLSGANLSNADLSNANLRGANLRGADLSSANLSDANLSDAIVVNAYFGENKGLTEGMKRDLKQRGAIFGDRPPVPVS